MVGFLVQIVITYCNEFKGGSASIEGWQVSVDSSGLMWGALSSEVGDVAVKLFVEGNVAETEFGISFRLSPVDKRRDRSLASAKAEVES